MKKQSATTRLLKWFVAVNWVFVLLACSGCQRSDVASETVSSHGEVNQGDDLEKEGQGAAAADSAGRVGNSTESFSSGRGKSDGPPKSAAELLKSRLIGAVQSDPAYKDADFRILFIGNSHTSTHQMPKTVQAMLQRANPGQRYYCAICAGGFLADHAQRSATLDLMDLGNWDIVVLQAQKYSTSGKYTYPHDAALALTRRAQQQGAKVIMYPEWGRRGNREEAVRIHKLHQEIASKSGASVAPVGLAWEVALQEDRTPNLYDSDGNHASPAGAYLTAAVFFHWILRRAPGELPDTEVPHVDSKQRQWLASIARRTVANENSSDSEPVAPELNQNRELPQEQGRARGAKQQPSRVWAGRPL